MVFLCFCFIDLSANRDRITSYNVCYTKLLRAARPLAPHCVNPRPWKGSVAAFDYTTSILLAVGLNTENPGALNRITSYNVCYTKLLRYVSHKIFFLVFRTNQI